MKFRVIAIIMMAVLRSGCLPKSAMLKYRDVQHIKAGLGVDGKRKIQWAFYALKKLEVVVGCIKQSYYFSPNEYEIAEYIEFHIENYLIKIVQFMVPH